MLATFRLRVVASVAALLLTGSSWSHAVEQAPAAAGDSAIPLVDPYTGLTPAQITSANETVDKIKDEHDIIFPTGDPNGDLWKQVNADRVKERIQFFDRYNEWNGDNGNVIAGSPIDGGFILKGQYIQNPRHFRSDRYLGPSGSFEVIDANSNILDDQQRRLNNIANKLSKSKFACGQFDWVLQLKSKFNKAALQKYVDSLAESALAAAPMALLANISPTLYEIVKFMRNVASMELNTEQLKCQQIEAAFTDIGRRTMRGEGYAECIRANQNLGVSEAHRICNQESSPYDGIENSAGKIQGFNGDTDNINLTNTLSDRISTGQPSAATADAQGKDQANQALANARAQLAASPDPGDADPNWADGSPEKTAWQEARGKHDQAQDRFDEATGNVQRAYSTNNDPGVWGRLRNSLADNLGSIIGNIDVGVKANLQFGNQDQYRLVLFYKHQAFLLAEKFADQLEIHFDVITQIRRNPDDIKTSYTYLMAYCFGTAQAPWMTVPPIELGKNRTSYDVRFGYATLDKLAVLWTKSRRGDENSVARTVWENEFRTTEAVNLITQFEVYDYLLQHAKRDKGKLMGEARNMLKQDGADKILANIDKAMNDYMELLEGKRTELIPQLAAVIDAVNKFELSRATSGYEATRRGTNTLPPIQQLGR